jgi:glycosyltransferase 2 family protein
LQQDGLVKALLPYTIKVVVGAGLLAATLWWASAADLAATFARVDATALLAVVALVVQIALAGERWRLLVAAAGTPISVKSGLQIGFVASLSGQILPGGAGVEVARIGMGRLRGLSWSRLVSLAVLDRMLLMFALGATAAGGLAVILPPMRPLLVAGLLGCFVAGALCLWLAATGRLEIVMRSRLVAAARNVLSAGKARPSLFLWAAGIAMLSPVNLALAVWVLARSMQIDLPLLAAIAWIPLVLVASAVPVSLGGWGVREAAAVALLSQAGVPAPEALALSISFGVASLIAALPGAFMMPTNWRRASSSR